MRAIAIVAAAGLISCAAANPSAAVYTVRATARDASAIAAQATEESSAFDLADWIPSDESAPWVIERRAGRTLFIDGTLRAALSPNGSVSVARERTQRAITQVFAPRDGQWVFVTEDGLVLSSPDFLGSFATRAELPAGVARSRKRFRRTAGIVALTDGTCWTLDAPATPRRLSDPAIDHVIDAATIDATRALLVTTPGQPWLWRQDRRSATPIDIGEDTALELDAQTRVLALHSAWKWTDAQRLVIDSAPAEPPSSFDPAEHELQRWRQWRRRAMFPFDQFCMYRAATEDAVISVGAEPEQLVVRRRTGEDIVLPALDGSEGLQRFGASIAWRGEGGAVRLVNTTDGSVTLVPSAPGAAPSTTVLAEDGSIIVNEDEDQRHLGLWTPQTSWTSTVLDAPLLVRHARAQRLYGARAETIFEATPNANGTVSVREVVRLSALRPSDGLRELIATNAHEQWRAWLFRERARRCFVVVEDGLSASVVDAPTCARDTSVYFAGRHFGILETEREVHVTRDGRTWSHRSRGQLDLQQAFVQSLLSLVTPTAAMGDAIVAWGNERIARDPSRSTPVARRSTPLPVARIDHEDAPTGTARCRLEGSRTTVRVSRSDVLDFAVDLIHARPSTDERSIDLRWRTSDGASGAYAGDAPWAASATLQSARGEFDPVAVAAHGAVMHQRGPRPILGSDLFRDTYMFASNRATKVDAVEPAAGRGYFVVADAVATVDGWQTLLVAQHEGYELVQWQRRDVTGAVTAHGEFTHHPARTLSLARSEDGWGAVDWRDGSASFYSFATRAWVAISAPDVVRWCRANEALPRFDEPLTSHATSATTHTAAATASILLRRSTNPLGLEGPLSVDQIERERTIAEYRVRREGDRWRWCIDRLSSRPIITERGAVVASEVLAAARWDLRAHESGDYASGTIIAPRSDRFVRATVRCDAIHPAR